MRTNSWVPDGPVVVFVYLHIILLHYHLYEDVSEGIELLNACRVHSVECVSKIKLIISIIFHAIYEAVCIIIILL